MRIKKAILNMASSMVYQIVAIICGLITPRMILLIFGSTYNGVVSSATQYLSMINILTFGITATTRVALYKTLADNDTLGTSRIMKATKRYMKKVAVCVVLYAVVLSILYPFISHNDLTKTQCSTLILIVSIGTFAEYFFGISNQTLLQAAQSSYITYSLDITKTILNTICVAVLIYFGASIYIVKFGSSVFFFITPVVMNYYVKKKYNLIDECEPDNMAIKKRGAAAFHVIANIVHSNADLVILTVFADAKLISVYTVYYLVVGKIRSLIQVFTTGMEAAFGDMWVKHELIILKRRFRQYEYIIYIFAAIIFSCVGLLIVPFIKIYTTGVNDIEYVRIPLAVLITITEAAYCIRQPYLTLVYATGSYEATKIAALLEAIINIVLSIILVWFIGIEGVIIGTLVANIFRTIQFSTFVSKKILNRSFLEIILRIIWLTFTVASIIIVANLVTNQIVFSSNWRSWFTEGLLIFIISCIITTISSLIFYRQDMFNLINTGIEVIFKKGGR